MKCFLCGVAAVVHEPAPPYHLTGYDCPNCGDYDLTQRGGEDLSTAWARGTDGIAPRHMISGWIRDQPTGGARPMVTYSRAQEIAKDNTLPSTREAKADHLLGHLASGEGRSGSVLHIATNHTAIAYAVDAEELRGIVRHLVELGYLELRGTTDTEYLVVLMEAGRARSRPRRPIGFGDGP